MKTHPKDSLAGATATPEPRGVVVARAAEDVAKGMEGEGPDVRVVGEFQLVLEAEVGHGPVDDGPFGAARDEDVVVDRVPGESWERKK